MDVAKITITDLETKKITATATATTSSINATLNEELLRAGWGGGVVATINSERNVELSFTDIFFSMDYLSMTAGSEVEEDAVGTVVDSFEGIVGGTAPSLTVDMPAGVTVTEAIFVDKDGSQSPVTVVTGKVEVPNLSDAKLGDTVTIFYSKEVTGQKVSIDAQKFPKYVSVQYHTRAFDSEKNTVVKDIYIQFDKVKPSGNFNLDLAVSTAANTELTFTAMNKSSGDTEMGRYFAIDRTP